MNEWVSVHFLDGRNGMKDKSQELQALRRSHLIYNFQSTCSNEWMNETHTFSAPYHIALCDLSGSTISFHIIS